MEDWLTPIDQDLIDLEDTLLGELRRLRKTESDDLYVNIEPALHNTLKRNYTGLLKKLEGSGDWGNLSLKSYEQEWVEGRMKVVRNLLVRELPNAFLDLSHNEHKASKDSEFGTQAHTAAPELAILDQQVAMHHIDGRTIEEIVKEKAEFTSKDLAKGHEQEKVRGPIAQSPDEIRKKLAGKRGQGSSSFESKELSNTIGPNNPTPVAPVRKKEIAQSPEEIRRKLAERQSAAAGKASFGAKDIASVSDTFKPAASTEKKVSNDQPATPTAGKAVFGAKDIEPEATRTIRQASASKTPEKKEPKGPALFEAKDLSDPKN